MTIRTATAQFEAWLGRRTPLNAAHLRLKHQLMAEEPHAFLRATFYRWMQLWGEVCPELNHAPALLAVGDLHADNFGTWPDAEGRLVWGINDFDEAYLLPYTIDLVRLATSVALAFYAGKLSLRPRIACDAILDGYISGLKAGGEPFVLAEKHVWLGEIAVGRLREPSRFWRKLESFPRIRKPLPAEVQSALRCLFPEGATNCHFIERISGLGSLGRQRYVAVADSQGGKIAREAKALAPSACVWALRASSEAIHYQQLLDRAVRCRDPFVRVEETWIVRRLSPNCSRVDLASPPKQNDEDGILYSMGWETANVHLGTPKAIVAVRRDLDKRPRRWLRRAARLMSKATQRDWQEWRSSSAR